MGYTCLSIRACLVPSLFCAKGGERTDTEWIGAQKRAASRTSLKKGQFQTLCEVQFRNFLKMKQKTGMGDTRFQGIV
jgi:hypothetical protein